MSSCQFTAVHAFLAAALVAVASAAEANPIDVSGYLTSAGAQAVTDSFGECWHTGEWKPEMHFGRCEPQPVRAATAVPQAAKPAPKAPEKPLIATETKPASKPVPFRISTDALFDFDTATLKPAGRAVLDKLEDQIAHAAYRSVDITGHTDRIGTPGYNRHLSERRAQAVRDYLAAQGLDSTKITTRGVGSTEPHTATDKCSGLHGVRFIQCLQPDRYAEVEVLGSAPQKSAMR
jgi:OOP family OmpA-OmpF porin